MTLSYFESDHIYWTKSAGLISNVESLLRLVRNTQELFNVLSRRNADGFNLNNHSPSEHSPVLKGPQQVGALWIAIAPAVHMMTVYPRLSSDLTSGFQMAISSLSPTLQPSRSTTVNSKGTRRSSVTCSLFHNPSTRTSSTVVLQSSCMTVRQIYTTYSLRCMMECK